MVVLVLLACMMMLELTGLAGLAGVAYEPDQGFQGIVSKRRLWSYLYKTGRELPENQLWYAQAHASSSLEFMLIGLG